MAESSIRLISPDKIVRNPENPRLIFRQRELDSLQESIANEGILVPLTVFQSGREYTILDGERRWRCALKLGLSSVPAIVQPEPDRMTNIMMMFAIHKTRQDWDPLPTAMKLEELEEEFSQRHKRRPTEQELANLASLDRGEVRRLKILLDLPESYRLELMAELEKPKSEQKLSVDIVLEATRGAAALVKRDVSTHVKKNSFDGRSSTSSRAASSTVRWLRASWRELVEAWNATKSRVLRPVAQPSS